MIIIAQSQSNQSAIRVTMPEQRTDRSKQREVPREKNNGPVAWSSVPVQWQHDHPCTMWGAVQWTWSAYSFAIILTTITTTNDQACCCCHLLLMPPYTFLNTRGVVCFVDGAAGTTNRRWINRRFVYLRWTKWRANLHRRFGRSCASFDRPGQNRWSCIEDCGFRSHTVQSPGAVSLVNWIAIAISMILQIRTER